VKVLSVGEDAAQVTGGVKPGEKIVALGAHLLHEGEVVRLAEQRHAARRRTRHERKPLQPVSAGRPRAFRHAVSDRSGDDCRYLRLFGLGRAEDPPFTVKQMTVIAVWPGATAQEMQDQVAEPLEKRLQELKWYDRTETYTRPGMAFITCRCRTRPRQPKCRRSSIRRVKSWEMNPSVSGGRHRPDDQ
jgi:hypothetical protein